MWNWEVPKYVDIVSKTEEEDQISDLKLENIPANFKSDVESRNNFLKTTIDSFNVNVKKVADIGIWDSWYVDFDDEVDVDNYVKSKVDELNTTIHEHISTLWDDIWEFSDFLISFGSENTLASELNKILAQKNMKQQQEKDDNSFTSALFKASQYLRTKPQ